LNIQNNNKMPVLPAGKLRLQRWGGWALLGGVVGVGSLALGTCESSAARGALSLLYRLLWA
jgi:hypothetical protein